jgi:hypothetical protein
VKNNCVSVCNLFDIKIRGCLTLVGAVVTPNEDDLLAFTISPVAGDSFKLKASDTKTKQVNIIMI